ncbi:hypothetical protein EF912_18195 [Streptomyces sp. WAC07061]|uniref:hypothetical protein n=1 Tax=Streptomyces sp. WAC07061 TaxID=2487410 RepID=UPI000F7788CD|nr:hypothetical protein [Streptomyces sp. WAC07061]RSS53555.1 hypothetical protein EF912_18195 [Streptomyces sp. WAC07061]
MPGERAGEVALDGREVFVAWRQDTEGDQETAEVVRALGGTASRSGDGVEVCMSEEPATGGVIDN